MSRLTPLLNVKTKIPLPVNLDDNDDDDDDDLFAFCDDKKRKREPSEEDGMSTKRVRNDVAEASLGKNGNGLKTKSSPVKKRLRYNVFGYLC